MEHQVFILHVTGEHASYEDNVEKLLSEMSKTNERNAQFRTVVAFVEADKQWIFEGICIGKISSLGKGRRFWL